ncbi:MAG: glycosyltransferase, partial [Candidatus Marsarchaeota archaeon]|nr:glycosyltransferase [Candidatus Marsarchaeota archaeon]
RAKLGLQDNERLIGMIGHFHWFKGHLDFLGAAAILKERTAHRLKFLIVGRELELRRSYPLLVKEKIDRLQLNEEMILAGYRKDVPDLLNAMDVLVVPSIYEPLGVIVMEGMAAGKPIVASRVGGIPEMVIDGEHALLFPSRDVQCLAACIERLLDEPELVRDLGAKARARVCERFSPEMAAAAYEHLYDSILDGDETSASPVRLNQEGIGS